MAEIARYVRELDKRRKTDDLEPLADGCLVFAFMPPGVHTLAVFRDRGAMVEFAPRNPELESLHVPPAVAAIIAITVGAARFFYAAADRPSTPGFSTGVPRLQEEPAL